MSFIFFMADDRNISFDDLEEDYYEDEMLEDEATEEDDSFLDEDDESDDPFNIEEDDDL